MAANSLKYKTALRRLARDLKELENEPIPEAALAPPREDDLFELHGNLIIPEGPYAGVMVHIVLTFDEGFPTTCPFGALGKNFPMTEEHHSHIHGTKLCNDYLGDYEFWFKSIDGGERRAASGWSS